MCIYICIYIYIYMYKVLARSKSACRMDPARSALTISIRKTSNRGSRIQCPNNTYEYLLFGYAAYMLI